MEAYMKVIVIGATGTIGSAVVKLLAPKHEVIAVSRSAGDHRADITHKATVETVLAKIGQVDAIVSAAGGAVFKPLSDLTDADFEKCLHDKLMGQVNVVRVGAQYIRPGGSITITSGILANEPMPGAAAISLVNAGLEGFARAAALELQSVKVRVNAVSPPWVTETLIKFKMDPAAGTLAADVAKAYARSVEGDANGQVIDARRV
jgi:NAD(P)-dependent dehydrogenase (short-subunit alcohol dehydrogenase family)